LHRRAFRRDTATGKRVRERERGSDYEEYGFLVASPCISERYSNRKESKRERGSDYEE
jgi:hypothetical protein